MKSKREGKVTPTKKRKGRGKGESVLTRNAITIMFILIAVVIAAAGFALFGRIGYSGNQRTLYFPSNSSRSAIHDTLTSKLGVIDGNRVYLVWRALQSDPQRARGIYSVNHGDRILDISRRIRNGSQTPVTVRFNSVRTMDMLAKKISSQMEFDPDEFISACDSILPENGFEKPQYPAAFLPDNYEFYITDKATKVVGKLLEYRNRFWNQSRVQKASALGLSPVDVATIASIVEEESGKRDEYPAIARLYINRYERGIPLQADPTVKFASGDFTLRRITGKHLKIESPYNTYRIKGLPPGPIRVVDKRTIDNVLDAPPHNFIYMCAKSDFSGYHDFASDYSTHMANARRYQAELNKRNIH